MYTDTFDDLLLFEDVTIISSTATALQCRIGKKVVWLPRHHVDGKLWSRGDRGKLSIRRWVARDRRLIDPHATALTSPARSGSRSPRARLLHLATEDRTTHDGD